MEDKSRKMMGFFLLIFPSMAVPILVAHFVGWFWFWIVSVGVIAFWMAAFLANED